MRRCFVFFGLFFSVVANARSASIVVQPHSIGSNPARPEVVRQCGVSLDTPNLKSVSDQVIGFGCIGSYKNGGKAVMDMDFQYDQNFDPRGGDNISFVVEGVSIDKRLSNSGESILKFNQGDGQPVLVPRFAYKESDCGAPVVKTIVSPIHGENWHGWIAEETFAKAHGQCKPAKEYTESYRCIHVLVGNEKMSAQLDGVCLLRKLEYSLKNGFSYDLFINMMKTLRFQGN
ncbi:hypothetical protein [Paraburkholderia bannensis]|uniref:hypothetical protein n=1 Tax=Paraburkholderia bannensis TaxID=765414 RepID=UPI002ABE23FF|nr:hypothetical protein [Paraburkholderia bannensis]